LYGRLYGIREKALKPLTEQEKNLLIKRSRLQISITEKTTIDDLLQYSWLKNKKRWKNNRRLNKKYHKYWTRYIPTHIASLFFSFMAMTPLRRRINYNEMAKKAIVVEPLPPGAVSDYAAYLGVIS
jgi:hypothetical protein